MITFQIWDVDSIMLAIVCTLWRTHQCSVVRLSSCPVVRCPLSLFIHKCVSILNDYFTGISSHVLNSNICASQKIQRLLIDPWHHKLCLRPSLSIGLKCSFFIWKVSLWKNLKHQIHNQNINYARPTWDWMVDARQYNNNSQSVLNFIIETQNLLLFSKFSKLIGKRFIAIIWGGLFQNIC